MLAAGSIRDTNLSQTDFKVNDDVISVRSRDFDNFRDNFLSVKVLMIVFE